MDTTSDANTADGPENERPQQGHGVALGNSEESDDSSNMRQRDVDDHGPVQGSLLVVSSHRGSSISNKLHHLLFSD